MASEDEWKHYTEAKYEGELSDNAQFALEVKKTPLEPEALLMLLWDNIGYFEDSYYYEFTVAIERKIEEYLQLKKV